MRKNILRQGEAYDDTELCLDLVECCSPADMTGFVVWGDPSYPRSWEVTEGFLTKWSWVIAGCWELFEFTNRWRKSRGEPAISFYDVYFF